MKNKYKKNERLRLLLLGMLCVGGVAFLYLGLCFIARNLPPVTSPARWDCTIIAIYPGDVLHTGYSTIRTDDGRIYLKKYVWGAVGDRITVSADSVVPND